MSKTAADPTRKIAVVVPKYGLAGGAEQFAASMTERLAGSTPYEFHVFAHQWRSQPGSPVLFHRLPERRWPRFLRPWAFAKAVERALRKDHFDLVHSHDRIFRADVFSLHCTPHRAWVRDVRAKTPSLFDRAMIGVERCMISGNPSATFLPVSSLSADLFHREYPDAKGHWKIMPPGVDYARFSGPDRDTCRHEIFVRHGIDPAAFIVLFVGMNFEHKGLDTVMEAVAKASRQRLGSKIHLLVIGKGNIGKYRTQATRLGLASSVTFAGAITSDLERYYRAADCLILLSAFDTFGMVVLEALAADLPVIISAEVGARDVVEDEHDGFIVQDREDAHAVARALIAIASVERRSAGTKSSFAKVRQHDWSARAEEIGLIYDSLMNPTGRDG
jgi:UDP-glucose:(heptosyl)LPS alpha-1,3-glucosyltransferase